MKATLIVAVGVFLFAMLIAGIHQFNREHDERVGQVSDDLRLMSELVDVIDAP